MTPTMPCLSRICSMISSGITSALELHYGDSSAALVGRRERVAPNPPVSRDHLLNPLTHDTGSFPMNDPKIGMLGEDRGIERGKDRLLGFFASEAAEVDLVGRGAGRLSLS